MKYWTFRNEGEQDWPEDTVFIQTNGDLLKVETFSVKGPVKPGQEVDVWLEMKAPILPGRYCAYFRFQHGENQRFGQKVWADILVDPEMQEQYEHLKESEYERQENSPLLNMSEQRVSSLLSEENS